MDRSHVVIAAWMLANQEAWGLMAPRPRHHDDDDEDDARLFDYVMGVARLDADDAYRDGGFGAVPATSEAIAGLREARLDDEAMIREEECAVCMEDFEAGDKLRAMPCSHCFHERCIFDWLRVSGICPLCRHRLPTEQS